MPSLVVRPPSDPAPEGEVPFGFEEIFFSRTDGRGVIQAGNSVFRRVSGYESAELVGAPHRIIRHPVMPKAAFYLLWERLRADLPSGVYVCNRARDGRPYWVFAVVVPIRDGYLSVRIKPGSAVFPRARALYEGLRTAEAAGQTPAEGAAELGRILTQENFPAYDAFQAQALAAEVTARAEARGLPAPRLTESVRAAGAAAGIAVELRAMQRLFRGALLITMNLRILAGPLGQRGRALSAIADNYAQLSNDMSRWLEDLTGAGGGFGGIARSVGENLFLKNTTALLDEMSDCFARDADAGVGDLEAERARLAEAAAHYRQRAAACRARALADVVALEEHLEQMRHRVSALDAIRMQCRVEGAGLRSAGSDLDQIVNQLDAFQDELAARLRRTMALGREILAAAAAL